ncbi:substrate-binding periplasmic protein [Neptunicella sp. SCSIO 80796]|uniref:substrate-binding periplasmic protein n=1 Tax=Neptunicella plasticusilytica TaxID=3117012 RepID=UPI003A4D6456
MRYLLLFFLFFSYHTVAADKIIKVAVNIGQPWAYFEEGKGMTGIDVEIIRHIFTQLGYQPEFHLLAYNRLIKEFNEGKFDIASPAAFSSETGYFTSAYLPFEDVAVTVKDRHLEINTIDDLADKRVVAYQHATSVLGKDYASAVAHANYLEFAQREVQIKLLAKDRTDVVIGECRLLTYINKKLYPEQELDVHPIFTTQSYGAVLKDQALQQLFEQELEEMKKSGLYQQILNKWP